MIRLVDVENSFSYIEAAELEHTVKLGKYPKLHAVHWALYIKYIKFHYRGSDFFSSLHISQHWKRNFVIANSCKNFS